MGILKSFDAGEFLSFSFVVASFRVNISSSVNCGPKFAKSRLLTDCVSLDGLVIQKLLSSEDSSTPASEPVNPEYSSVIRASAASTIVGGNQTEGESGEGVVTGNSVWFAKFSSRSGAYGSVSTNLST